MRRQLTTLAIVCLAFASIHLRIYVTQPGLDPSWEFALNHAHANTDYVFGRDIVFTYGPLGFLARPHAIGTNIQQAALFAGVLALLAALSIGLFANKTRNQAGFWLFFAGFTIANAFGLWEEYYYSSVLALCLLAGKFFESRFLLIAAGALGPVLLMLKFSTGLAAASMIGVTVLALPWRRALLLIAPYTAVLLASVAIFFHGPATFFRWLWFSLEVATGYGVAMSLSGPPIEAVAGILIAATLWSSAILTHGRQLQFPLLLFAVPVLLALKHAAVGQNHMTAGLFLFLVSIAGVLALFATGRRETYAVAALLVVTITAAAAKGVSATGNPPVTPLRFFRFFTAQKVREAIGRTLRSDESPGQFGARSLPAAWLQPLRESPGVDVLPFELSYIAQYGLRWRPNFILQNYKAYTARLDHEVAENIRAGVRAPDMLLLEFIGVDGRHLMLDTPENFRAILARYHVVGVDYARNLMLVRRRPAIERQPATFASTRAAFGEWSTVPAAKGKLYARMRFKESLAGRLKHLFWQIPAIHLEIEYAGGRTAQFRMLAETASNGILLNTLPANLQDLHDLFFNTAYDEVRRFRITGPGVSSYQQQFAIDWELDADPAFSNLRASQPAAPELVSWSQAPERLTLTYRDPNGYRDLEYIQAIANDAQDGRHACYLSYEPKRQILILLNDEGNGFAGVGSIGGPEILKNEKCSVSLAASSVHVERDQVALTLAIRLRSRTPQKLFATAIDGSKLTAPWRLLSKWAR